MTVPIDLRHTNSVFGGSMGKWVKEIGKCVVRAIQKRFPEKNGDYVPFLEFVEST